MISCTDISVVHSASSDRFRLSREVIQIITHLFFITKVLSFYVSLIPFYIQPGRCGYPPIQNTVIAVTKFFSKIRHLQQGSHYPNRRFEQLLKDY